MRFFYSWLTLGKYLGRKSSNNIRMCMDSTIKYYH
ncbi:hypothetical protein T06_5278 [Trichinella sp. T6]|nr:hypothetical protein T06_5278 [Trichinella sp. T6]